jgi:AcrR family transcriptional regulator
MVPRRADATMTDTRQRLLEAACEVFAARGFRAATVRDISNAPGRMSPL